MSTIDNTETKQGEPKVVRLKVDGASTAVNTLNEQQTKRGVSLICPFPALEVNLKASFGAAGDGEMKTGTIHRIGVEDDPESGLPRLRLSICADEPRKTAVEETPIQLIEESSKITKPDKAESIPDSIATSPPAYDIPEQEGDPQWVNCDEIPLPEEFLARSKTRRRYKMVRNVIYLSLFLCTVAAGIAVERAGIVTIDDVRSYVAGLALSSGYKPQAQPTAEPAPPAPEEIATVDATDAPPVSEPASKPEVVATESATNEQAPDIALASASTIIPATPQPESPAAAPKEEPKAAPESEKLTNEVTIILPTRWPAEYASGYRIRDPNGVVIDVPGGLVKKEGWLEQIAKNPMIRSVKSIQRETGARFVVYVNGSLPRFMTSPRPDGVSLRLYDLSQDAIATQEVAMAQ